MAVYTVTIPNFLPTRLNAMLRWHWAKQRRVKKEDQDIVGAYCRIAHVAAAGCRRRVSVRFESPRTPADPDARLKHLLDGLVLAGALRDDSPQWCKIGDIESVRGKGRNTIITLEDMETEA